MVRPRSLVLLAALGLTLAATWYATSLDDPADDADAAEALLARPLARQPAPLPAREQRPGANGPVRDAIPAEATETATRSVPAPAGQRIRASSANLFAVRSWQPPPPPPPSPVEQPVVVPIAPPLPYRYLGRMEDSGRITVFLGEGAQSVRVVRQGDQLADYRIDEINAQGMRLTYLPLQQQQQLLFGSPK